MVVGLLKIFPKTFWKNPDKTLSKTEIIQSKTKIILSKTEIILSKTEIILSETETIFMLFHPFVEVAYNAKIP